MSIVHIQACGGVIQKFEGNNQYVLLIRKKNSSFWTLPKGHKEMGENDETTALREVKEETGYSCCIEDVIGDIQYQYQKKGKNFSEKVTYFLMKPEENSGSFDTNEIDETCWVSIDKACEQLFFENEKEIIRKILNKNI